MKIGLGLRYRCFSFKASAHALYDPTIIYVDGFSSVWRLARRVIEDMGIAAW